MGYNNKNYDRDLLVHSKIDFLFIFTYGKYYFISGCQHISARVIFGFPQFPNHEQTYTHTLTH